MLTFGRRLEGIPILVKDMFWTLDGMDTTGSCNLDSNHRSC